MRALHHPAVLTALSLSAAGLIAWVWAASLTDYADFFLTSALFRFLC